MFDGYPRTRAQACQLDSIFADLNMALNAVIAIMVDPEVLIARITARRTCSTCNTIVNLALDPSNTFDRCPTCGGELVQREDDNETVVRRRIEGYHEQTEPLLSYYESRGILFKLEGLGTVRDVQTRVSQILTEVEGPNTGADPSYCEGGKE